MHNKHENFSITVEEFCKLLTTEGSIFKLENVIFINAAGLYAHTLIKCPQTKRPSDLAAASPREAYFLL